MGILSMIFSIEALLLVITLLVLGYLHSTWHFGKFKKKGIFYLKGQPFFGSIKDRVLFKISILEMDKMLYDKMAGHKLGGYFEGRLPVLLIRDPELAKDVLVKNFDHFINRRSFDFLDSDPILGKMMSLMQNQEWKSTRSVMTPTFTSGKLKKMVALISDCGEQLADALKEDSQKGNAVETKEMFNRFTLDVIATTAFGIQTNSVKDPNNEFFKMASKLVNPSKWRSLFMFAILSISSKLFGILGLSLFPPDATGFLTGAVRSTIAYREKSGERRNDFLQLLIDASRGNLENDDGTNTDSKISHQPANAKAVLTEEIIISQCVLFFFAGLETVSTLLSFATYELALEPEIQEKLQSEIDRVLEKYDGKCTYEAIQEMEYLDMVIQETLRKNPNATRLDRKCNSPYKIPGTDVTIEKGDLVMVSIAGQNFDEELFPNPQKFDPERFSAENKAKRNPYIFLPFGTGPRNCIGDRFALIETKIGLASLLHRYSLTMDEKTDVPYKFDNLVGGTRTKSGIWVKLTERSH